MLITNQKPSNWRDLQESVALILRQCGFSAETDKTVTTVRGNIDLDVFAKENIDGRGNLYVFECKYWNKRVPKSVVHSFRTVINDLGYNFGYIIAKSGFQSGAFDASNFSAVKLLTWEEFQEEFFEVWYKNYFVVELKKITDSIWSNCELWFPDWANNASREDVVELEQARGKYCSIELFVSSKILMNYSFLNNFNFIGADKSSQFIKLPAIQDKDIDKNKITDNQILEILETETYNEFLDNVKVFLREGVSEFSRLRSKMES